jgi:hypothetical protein
MLGTQPKALVGPRALKVRARRSASKVKRGLQEKAIPRFLEKPVFTVLLDEVLKNPGYISVGNLVEAEREGGRVKPGPDVCTFTWFQNRICLASGVATYCF